eukprot:TRINITY_DN7546_c0_g1_i4.p1 TRINITY_DN7546_c0_g1~~TRINITY_DN7546_c0_g1_i4.p1  ORF type:complete len:259 (+),score=59.93 TRINITY_DN7546_c0_g1_i4:317-1093(+)
MQKLGGRSQAVDDFIRWYASTEAPKPNELTESLPPGVPSMSSRYGTFGSKATLGADDPSRLPTCTDSEVEVPPPCAATGECGDFLTLARRFQEASAHAKKLSDEATAALNVSQTLLRRAKKGAKTLAAMPELSNLSLTEPMGPGGNNWDIDDIIARNLRGPYEPGDRDKEDITARLMDRWDQDYRTAEYLRKAEGESDITNMPASTERVPIYKPFPKEPITPVMAATVFLLPAALAVPGFHRAARSDRRRFAQAADFL